MTPNMRRIGLFFTFSPRRQYLLVFTFVLAIFSWFSFRFFPSRTRFSSKKMLIFRDSTELDQKFRSLCLDIRWAILVVSHQVFFEQKCRHQAWQAKKICNWYGIPYTIFVGFKKNEEGQIEGHAWTEAGGIQISGLCDPQEYHLMNTYSNFKTLNASPVT